MSASERIRTALERNLKAVELRPALGRGTAVTRARLVEGLCCEVEEGDWKLTVDVGEKSGGTNQGPNPGILGRGALASCLVVGYSMWAARRGITLDSIDVEVQADYDARGELGVAEVPPGYSQIRYIVSVESSAPEQDVLALIEEADAHSPYLDVFARALDLKRELRLSRTGE